MLISGVSFGAGHHLAVDLAGNVFVAGQVVQTTDFGGGIVVSNPNCECLFFLGKYDGSGNLLWVRQGTTDSQVRDLRVTTDFAGSVFLTGDFGNILTFNTAQFYTFGNQSLFIVKCDSAGNLLWSNEVDAQSPDGSVLNDSVVTDPLGNLLLAGHFDMSAGFGGLALWKLAFDPTGNFSFADAFIAAYSPTGELIGVRQIGSEQVTRINSLLADSVGGIYLAGQFGIAPPTGLRLAGTNLFDFGTIDMFLAKMNTR